MEINEALKAGLIYDEDPMNPQYLIWSYEGAKYWYQTPREALKAKEESL